MIGRHSKLQFWTNNWLGYPLINLVSDGVSLEPPIHALVKDFMDQNGCKLPDDFSSQFSSVAHDIHQIIVRDSDTLIWRKSACGNVTCSDAYASLMGSNGFTSWGKSIWASYVPPSRSFLLWRIFHGKLPTDEAFSNRGICLPGCYKLCFKGPDSVCQFLFFFGFSFAKVAWEEIFAFQT